MKITVAEYLEFDKAWSDHPAREDWYLEKQEFPHEDRDGNLLPGINRSDKFELTGQIFWQGRGDPRPSRFFGEWSLATAISKWRKARDFDVLTVTVPKDKTEAVRAAAVALGAKVG